jgi:hypothetical protein
VPTVAWARRIDGEGRRPNSRGGSGKRTGRCRGSTDNDNDNDNDNDDEAAGRLIDGWIDGFDGFDGGG